jgi:ribosomal-protein-alanine N-acetyltransferase
LRQLHASDAPEIYRIRSNDRVRQFLDRPKAKSLADARAFIEKIKSGIQEDKWIYWGITNKEPSKLMGTICLWNFSEEKDRAEVGFELLPAFQKQGFVDESLKTVLHYAFRSLHLKTLSAFTNPKNVDSVKLLLKNQFVLESRHLKSQNHQEQVYRLEKDQYNFEA